MVVARAYGHGERAAITAAEGGFSYRDRPAHRGNEGGAAKAAALLQPLWQEADRHRTLCARRDSNAGPSAPEAAPVSDHQRWPLSFQALARVARRPAPVSDGRIVTAVVTAGPCLLALW